MRIPIFRSQAQATNEAPGSRIQARMNAQPFVQAALAKGEVFGSAMKGIGDYALVRAKAEAEVQYNEAMLAAEEEMRTLAESLKENGRLGDVINEKGTGAWQLQTKDMRERLADGLSSRSMTDAFNARFNQQELTLRFQLRDAIETRIKARAAAAAKARQESMVNQLSDPNTPVELAAMLLTSQDAELQASVANGIMTPETRAAVNSELLGKIVDNVTAGYVAADPAKAIALSKALEYQAQVDAGLMTSAEAAELSGLGPDASYTLSVLRMARPDVAINALAAAVTTANKLDGAMDEARAEQTAATNLSNQNLYNSTFGVNPTAPASLDLTQRLQAANPQALALAGISPDQPISGKQYLDAATNALDRQNFLSLEQRKALDTHRNPDVTGPFALQTDPAVFKQLHDKLLSGRLTMQDLNANIGDLSQEDWKAMSENMQTEAKESFALVDDRVASAFNYNKAVAPTDDQAKEAQAAYAFVTAQLTREFNAAREAGTPMTSTQLTTRANELVDERMVSYRATLQLKFRDYLESVMSTNPGANLPNFTPGNELNELDVWYRGLTDPTPTQESVYSALRGQIRNHYSSMGIQ
jgi:hypothetical protein